MTEMEWTILQRTGRQAEHQARQILARALAASERGTMQEALRRWAQAVLRAAAAPKA